MHTKSYLIGLLALAALAAHAQQIARIVHYHANDIVAIRAKMHYTTLIALPSSEKILEVATGDKDFWILDAVQNYCFLHPAKADLHSNLNLITDKGNVYSFTLDDVETADPDLKVVIDRSIRSIDARQRAWPGEVCASFRGRRCTNPGEDRGTTCATGRGSVPRQLPGRAFELRLQVQEQTALRHPGHLSR